ncbi:MAG: tRNA (adenosine(37)-N6)-dimethylallyltransferase MiaA [Candidatus Omnitrophota bacterium]|nr:MAG: tRNA (adenosine(37)-N6)-dimethylallyltransferase MiaA [Candidatus Omnitrophota bacterium]
MKKRVICLIGPTASGKTEIALKLAKRIGAEIISCDSMQIYKGIDIATSKPTKAETRRIPHHLIDVLSPSQEYNVALFKKSALEKINHIHKKGKVPLIVGGSGLYLRALIDGLFEGPGRDSALRNKLSQQAKKYGKAYLYRKLKKQDPEAACKIHPHDLRRIIRALEVYKLAREPISARQKKTFGIRDKYDLRIFGLRRKRDELYRRIERRVDKMFRKGLASEIKRVMKHKISRTAEGLLGYREIAGYLKGEYSKDRASELLKRNTRHYAKRQISWFKNEKGVNWIELSDEDKSQIIADKIGLSLSR